MAVKTLQYASPITADTARGPSQSIWYDCPLEDFIQGYGGGIGTAGYMAQDDFISCPFPALNAQASFGQWSCFADTGSTIVDQNEEGGVVMLNNGTAGKTVLLASSAGSFKMVSGASGFPLGQKLWFECRVAMGAISGATEGYFVGLADNTSTQITSSSSTILATTANSFTGTKGFFGFTRLESAPTDWKVAYQVAGGSTVAPTNLTTLVTTVAGTAPVAYASTTNGNGKGFVKLGFVFDPTAGNPSVAVSTTTGDGTLTQTAGAILKPIIKFYVNGQLCNTFLDPTLLQNARFPTARMAPVIQFMDASGGGGSSTGLAVDWIRVAQLASF